MINFQLLIYTPLLFQDSVNNITSFPKLFSLSTKFCRTHF